MQNPIHLPSFSNNVFYVTSSEQPYSYAISK